jgi:hypothetical protein
LSRVYDIRSIDIVGIRCVPECPTLVWHVSDNSDNYLKKQNLCFDIP